MGMELAGRHCARHPLRGSDDRSNARARDRRGVVSWCGHRNQHDGFLMDPGLCPSTDPGCHRSIRFLPDRAALRRGILSWRLVARVPGSRRGRQRVQRSSGFPDGPDQLWRRRTNRACVRASRLHQLFRHAGPGTAARTVRLGRRRLEQHGGRRFARLLAETLGRERRCDRQHGASQRPGTDCGGRHASRVSGNCPRPGVRRVGCGGAGTGALRRVARTGRTEPAWLLGDGKAAPGHVPRPGPGRRGRRDCTNRTGFSRSPRRIPQRGASVLARTQGKSAVRVARARNFSGRHAAPAAGGLRQHGKPDPGAGDRSAA